MIYQVEFSNKALKELKRIDRQNQIRLLRAIKGLQPNPRKAAQARPMTGVSSWRLRVGDYRIIYDIYDKKLVILIVRMRHRRDAYKQ